MALAENCKRMTELNLSGCRKITDKSLLAIADHSSQLMNINLAYTSISDTGTLALATGVCASKLHVSDHAFCFSVYTNGNCRVNI